MVLCFVKSNRFAIFGTYIRLVDRFVPSATTNLFPVADLAREVPINSKHRRGAAAATRKLSGLLGFTAHAIPTVLLPVNDLFDRFD